jgi:hypothetical protein
MRKTPIGGRKRVMMMRMRAESMVAEGLRLMGRRRRVWSSGRELLLCWRG